MPKARLQLGGRQSPEAELPTCCCPSWGASSSRRGRPLGPGSEAGGGGSPARQVLPAGRAGAAGVASSPPRGGSRGWTRGQARCDWPAAAGGGARPPVSRGPPQKSPGYCRAHWIPGQRAACPAPPAGKLALGHSGLLWRARSYKPLDLTCLRAPLRPLHVPMLLRQQQVRAAVCFLPRFCLAARVPWGVWTRAGAAVGSRLFPPAPLLQRCPAVRLQQRAPTLPLSPRACL